MALLSLLLDGLQLVFEDLQVALLLRLFLLLAGPVGAGQLGSLGLGGRLLQGFLPAAERLGQFGQLAGWLVQLAFATGVLLPVS